jgi:isoleucyl-tRNA synthetase
MVSSSEGKPEYIFYDGPPFATGLPHYRHILAGILKVCAWLSFVIKNRELKEYGTGRKQQQ